MPLLTDTDKVDFLTKRGWVHHKQPHAWQWSLPPLKALYLLGDAFDLQGKLGQMRVKSKRTRTRKD